MTLVSSEGGLFQIGPVTLSFARCPKPIYANSAYETTASGKALSSPVGNVSTFISSSQKGVKKTTEGSETQCVSI